MLLARSSPWFFTYRFQFCHDVFLKYKSKGNKQRYPSMLIITQFIKRKNVVRIRVALQGELYVRSHQQTTGQTTPCPHLESTGVKPFR